jgi:ribose transport system substrate-binding protein
MSRGIAAILAALAVVALAACGSSSSSSGGGGGGGKKKLALIAGVKGDQFYITMNCGAQAEAKKKGVSLSFQGPDQFDASLQTPIVSAVAAKKPDAILVAPTDTKAMYAPIKQAAQNSKIVLVDTTLDDASVAASQIASNNLEGGKAAGQELTKLIGGNGKVMVTNVKPGISTTDLRQKGFEQAVKSSSGVDYIGTQYNNDDPAKAASIVTATLAKHPDLKGIFATNLFGAEGAASGLKQAGKLGQVKIIGFDAGPKQVQDLKSGLVQALIAQKPGEIGADGVDQALNAINGKKVTKKIGTGFVVVTKKNINDPNVSKYLYKSNCGTQ